MQLFFVFFNIILLTIGAFIYGIESLYLQDYLRKQGEFSFYRDPQFRHIKLAIHPQLFIHEVDISMDINLYLPLHSKNFSSLALSNLTLRNINYNHPPLYQIKFNRVRNLFYGKGLLVDHLGSQFFQQDLRSRDMGLEAQLKGALYTLDFLWSMTHLQGFQLHLFPSFFNGIHSQFIYLSNSIETPGKDSLFLFSRDKKWGASFALIHQGFGESFQPFLEISTLDQQGEGLKLGFDGYLSQRLSYLIAYIATQHDFTPSYFNRAYYHLSNPTVFKQLNGLEFDFEMDFIPNRLAWGFGTQLFKNYQSVDFSLKVVNFKKHFFSINYCKPLNSDNTHLIAYEHFYKNNQHHQYSLRLSYFENNLRDDLSVQVSTCFSLNYLYDSLKKSL